MRSDSAVAAASSPGAKPADPGPGVDEWQQVEDSGHRQGLDRGLAGPVDLERPTLVARPGVGSQQEPQAGGIDEPDPAQIQRHAARRSCQRLVQRGVEGLDRSDVHVAPDHDRSPGIDPPHIDIESRPLDHHVPLRRLSVRRRDPSHPVRVGTTLHARRSAVEGPWRRAGSGRRPRCDPATTSPYGGPPSWRFFFSVYSFSVLLARPAGD